MKFDIRRIFSTIRLRISIKNVEVSFFKAYLFLNSDLKTFSRSKLTNCYIFTFLYLPTHNVCFSFFLSQKFRDLQVSKMEMAKGSKEKRPTTKKIKFNEKNTKSWGIGCGSVGRAVASESRGPGFKSSLPKNLIEHCLLSTDIKVVGNS